MWIVTEMWYMSPPQKWGWGMGKHQEWHRSWCVCWTSYIALTARTTTWAWPLKAEQVEMPCALFSSSLVDLLAVWGSGSWTGKLCGHHMVWECSPYPSQSTSLVKEEAQGLGLAGPRRWCGWASHMLGKLLQQPPAVRPSVILQCWSGTVEVLIIVASTAQEGA